MSTRRYPGEIVRLPDAPPLLFGDALPVVRLTDLRDGDWHRVDPWCLRDCGDSSCQSWANAFLLFGEYAGQAGVSHVSECEMGDLTPEDRAALGESPVLWQDDPLDDDPTAAILAAKAPLASPQSTEANPE